MQTAEALEQHAASLQEELAKIVGREHVFGVNNERRVKPRRKQPRQGQRTREDLQTSLAQFSIDGITPETVVSPSSDQEVAAIVRLANEHRVVVVPAGGFTKQTTGRPPERIDILLRANRLNKVLHYDAGDLTLGVGAGMPVGEVQKALSAHAQFLPLDPMSAGQATIGGVMATNARGPMRSGFGGVRDYCIGVNYVTGDGKIAKAGGKVVKNVAGYDMMKLMIGSYGTLGIITSANFKVFPMPQQTCTFLCECRDVDEAFRLRERIIASPLSPMCLEIISPRAQEYLGGRPEARDPDHYAPSTRMNIAAAWQVIVRAAGSSAVLQRYRAELGSAVSGESNGEAEQELWRRIADFEHSIAVRHRNSMVVSVSTQITSVRQAYDAAEQSAVEHNLLSAAVGRAAVGSALFAFVPLGVDPPSAMQFANAASSLRSRLPKGSSAVVLRCPTESKLRFDVWGDSPTDFTMMRGVKAAMNPNDILNRGRFVI